MGRIAAARSRRTPPSTERADVSRAAAALTLQRAVGNAATQQLLARKPAATPATFRVMLVDDGNSGLDHKTVDIALGHVRDELRKVTSASSDASVKAGFDVQVRKDAPKYHTDLEPKDLDVKTWLVFLVRGGESERAVDLSYDYLQLDHADREKYEKNAKASLAGEGGYNLQTYKQRPGHPSQSVSFVDTDVPLKMEKDKSFGARDAGRVMAEVILHELGHAMGHVKRGDEGIDHDNGGIMAKATVIGTSGPYAPVGYSSKSAEIIRARLEWIAQGIAARAARTP